MPFSTAAMQCCSITGKKIELAFRSLEICLTGRLHAERCRATDAAPATLGPLGFGNAKLPTATAVLDY
jgi:hypothetical protein